MALFQEPTNGRQYSCFVCGTNFSKLIEYRDHILERHEEGREYVKCRECGYPVRDLRLHHKVKHPHKKPPKKGQMRALIWKDQGSKGKRKKPSFKEGYITSIKNHGKSMHYRSGYEYDVYQCLENLKEVCSYKEEPFPVTYYFKGEKKQYWPDIIVEFMDGKKEIWEIKPANQTLMDVNQAKWNACNNYCKDRGWEFIVMTEHGISKLKKRVKAQNA